MLILRYRACPFGSCFFILYLHIMCAVDVAALIERSFELYCAPLVLEREHLITWAECAKSAEITQSEAFCECLIKLNKLLRCVLHSVCAHRDANALTVSFVPREIVCKQELRVADKAVFSVCSELTSVLVAAVSLNCNALARLYCLQNTLFGLLGCKYQREAEREIDRIFDLVNVTRADHRDLKSLCAKLTPKGDRAVDADLTHTADKLVRVEHSALEKDGRKLVAHVVNESLRSPIRMREDGKSGL